MEPKSPFDSVLNFVSRGNDKGFSNACYNAVAVVLTLLGLGGCVAVYFVLEPFIKPLLWALLIGSFLHPIKQKATNLLRKWLKELQDSGTPFFLGIATLPVKVVDHGAEQCGIYFAANRAMMTGITVIFPLVYLLYNLIPTETIVSLLSMVFHIPLNIFNLLNILPAVIVWTIICGYVLSISMFWQPAHIRTLCRLSLPVWIILIVYLVGLSGNWKFPLVLAVFALFLIGLVTEISDRYRNDGKKISFFSTTWQVLGGESNAEIAIQGTELEKQCGAGDNYIDQKSSKCKEENLEGENTETDVKDTDYTKEPSECQSDQGLNSNTILFGMFWACILYEIWMHMWIIHLLPIPIGYYLIKNIGSYFGLWKFLQLTFLNTKEKFEEWFADRKEAIFPAPLRGLFKTLLNGDKIVLHYLDDCIDSITTYSVIILLLLFAILGTVFISVQIYGETLHLIEVGSNIINNTLIHNHHLFPEGFDAKFNDLLNNTYVYGRDYISDMVKKISGEVDDEKAHQAEKQLLELWDKVYAQWIKYNDDTENEIKTRQRAGWDHLLDGISGKHTTGVRNGNKWVEKWHNAFLNVTAGDYSSMSESYWSFQGWEILDILSFSVFTEFIQENLGFIMSVAAQIWGLITSNLSIAFNALTSIMQLLFGGGTALLNLVINFIIFVTALTYILSSSGNVYKPVEIVSSLSPITNTRYGYGLAIEDAINSIFMASFKMAGFYGMWTWLIHNLFRVKFVIIPSALAASLASIPILGPYWAGLPAVIELWLVMGRGMDATLFFICMLLPTMLVDTTIYSEIKGAGHPYLTGLAVAGGIFCLGIEGAFFGPIILCCLVIGINVYRNMMQDSRYRPHFRTPLKRMNTMS